MQSIEQLLTRIQDAWNRADVSAYAACYAADATYLTRAGALLTGRAEIEQAHGVLFRESLKGTQLRASLRHVTPLTESIVVVHADIELSGPATVWAVSTFVIRDGLIVAAQTTEV